MRPITAALCLALCPLPAAADATAAAPQLRIIPGWRQADGSRIAAIEIRLAPGWHTYWRVPGDAGIPPSFDWSRSRNVASVAYEWPRPERFESYGLESFGFERELVLPVRLTPIDPEAPLALSLDAAFGVCSDICVAASAETAASLAPGAEEGRDAIEAALSERPLRAGEAGVARVTCGLAPAAGGYEIVAEVTFAGAAAPGQQAIFEPGVPDLWVGPSETTTAGRTLTARAPVAAAGGGGPVLARDDLRLTLVGADRAVDIRGCDPPG